MSDEQKWPVVVPYTFFSNNGRRVQHFMHIRNSMDEPWHILGAPDGWQGWYEHGRR